MGSAPQTKSSCPRQLLDAAWSPQLNSRVLAFISAATFLMILGYAWPVFFNDGSALGKNLEFRETLDAVDDESVEAAMAQALYGEEPAENQIEARDPYANIGMLRLADRVAAILCLTLTLALPFLIRWKAALAWAYIIPALWILLNALAAMDTGGKAHASLSIPAHATRILMPVALALLVWRPASTQSSVNWLLRVACALTFGIHGYEALRHHPGFQDLIYSFFAISGLKLSSDTIQVMLTLIGVMDMLLVLSVLLIHKPALLRWMAFWGLITALSRPLTISWLAWPELAIRLANGLCPWLILAIGLGALIPNQRQMAGKTALDS